MATRDSRSPDAGAQRRLRLQDCKRERRSRPEGGAKRTRAKRERHGCRESIRDILARPPRIPLRFIRASMKSLLSRGRRAASDDWIMSSRCGSVLVMHRSSQTSPVGWDVGDPVASPASIRSPSASRSLFAPCALGQPVTRAPSTLSVVYPPGWRARDLQRRASHVRGKSWVRAGLHGLGFEAGTGGDHLLLQIAPQRDRQAPGHRHDHDPLAALAGTPGALTEPAAQGAVRLVAQP